MMGLLTASRAFWTRLTHGLRAAGRRVFVFLQTGLHRVTHRWREDSLFRRTLTAAVTAITSTAIPHPAVSAAVGALLTERPHRSRTGYDSFDEDEDDYPRRDWPTSPNRLWDSLT